MSTATRSPNLAGYRHFLDEVGAVKQAGRAGGPGEREEVVWNQAAQNEYGKGAARAGKDLREDEGQDGHHDDGIEQAPKDAERHVAVASAELLKDELA